MRADRSVALALSALVLPQVLAIRLLNNQAKDVVDERDIPVGDPCRCLPWKDVYESGQAICGEYAEMSGMLQPRLDHPLDVISEKWAAEPEKMNSLCKEFLPKLDLNYCLPYWDKLEESGSWCYVSDQCMKLGTGKTLSDKAIEGGMILKREIAGKTCEPWERRLDRDLMPEELYQVAKRNKINLVDAMINLYDNMFGQTWMALEKAWKAGNWTKLKNNVLRDAPLAFPLTTAKRKAMVIMRRNKAWDVFLAPKRCPETKYCIEKRPEEITIPENVTWTPGYKWEY